MQPLRVLFLYLAVVFFGGALLAPWLFWLTSWGGQHSSWLQHLAANPFHRFVHRALLALAVLGLWPLLRAWNIRSWSDLGLVNPAKEWRGISRGFCLGFSSLALVVMIVVLSGARALNLEHTMADYGTRLWKAGATALVVSVLEEILFRGALFGALRKTMRWPIALVVSSVVYAWVHFFQRPIPPDQIQWTSGLMVLPQMMRGFAEWGALVPGFFSLIVVGLLLGLAYQRTGKLYFSIGLHAGWIFWLKFYGFLTVPAAGNPWFWGSDKLIDGWLALIILGIVWLTCFRWLAKDRTVTQA